LVIFTGVPAALIAGLGRNDRTVEDACRPDDVRDALRRGSQSRSRRVLEAVALWRGPAGMVPVKRTARSRPGRQ
jgi:hypothetical protein